MSVNSALARLRAFDSSRLDFLFQKMSSLKVVVIGDYFLDKYLDLDPALDEISLETGKTAHQVVGISHFPGAAGNVAANVAALGVRDVRAVGFRGEDGEGWELEADLLSMGVDASGLFVWSGRRTPTYLKPRDLRQIGLAGEGDRIDFKNRDRTPRALEELLIGRIEAGLGEPDVLLVTDQVDDESAGVVTPFVRNAILDLAKRRRGTLVAMADSRKRILDFGGLVLKMNSREFSAIDRTDSLTAPDEILEAAELGRAVAVLEARAGSPVFVTAGRRGAWIGGTDPSLVPGLAIEGDIDSTGAGDSFAAASALALASGASFAEAALVGCLASSETVRILGRTGVPTRAGMQSALGQWRAQRL